MKIGVVTVWGERGASVVSKSYIDILAKEHDVFVYSRGGEPSIRDNRQADNIWFGKETYLPITTHIDKKDFLKWVLQNHIELVLFNEQHWFEPLVWLKELGIKSVSYVDYYTEETVPLYDLYDAVICNTKRHLKAFQDHHNAKFIAWGVDNTLYSLEDNIAPDITTTFFHSCGMNPLRKGTDLLLKSSAALTGNFHLYLHSQVDLQKFYHDNTPVLECLNKLENDNKLTVVTKSVSAPGLYKHGHVYVYPCRLDGLGLTVPEAISSGLPCIIPDAEPMKEFASPACSLVKVDRFFARKDGYYWPQQLCDIKDLTEKMGKYTNCNDIHSKMNTARVHATEKLDWTKNASGLNQFMRDIRLVPITEEANKTYQRYRHHGYRKVFTKMEKFSSFFSFLFFVYAKLKKT